MQGRARRRQRVASVSRSQSTHDSSEDPFEAPFPGIRVRVQSSAKRKSHDGTPPGPLYSPSASPSPRNGRLRSRSMGRAQRSTDDPCTAKVAQLRRKSHHDQPDLISSSSFGSHEDMLRSDLDAPLPVPHKPEGFMGRMAERKLHQSDRRRFGTRKRPRKQPLIARNYQVVEGTQFLALQQIVSDLRGFGQDFIDCGKPARQALHDILLVLASRGEREREAMEQRIESLERLLTKRERAIERSAQTERRWFLEKFRRDLKASFYEKQSKHCASLASRAIKRAETLTGCSMDPTADAQARARAVEGAQQGEAPLASPRRDRSHGFVVDPSRASGRPPAMGPRSQPTSPRGGADLMQRLVVRSQTSSVQRSAGLTQRALARSLPPSPRDDADASRRLIAHSQPTSPRDGAGQGYVPRQGSRYRRSAEAKQSSGRNGSNLMSHRDDTVQLPPEVSPQAFASLSAEQARRLCAEMASAVVQMRFLVQRQSPEEKRDEKSPKSSRKTRSKKSLRRKLITSQVRRRNQMSSPAAAGQLSPAPTHHGGGWTLSSPDGRQSPTTTVSFAQSVDQGPSPSSSIRTKGKGVADVPPLIVGPGSSGGQDPRSPSDPMVQVASMLESLSLSSDEDEDEDSFEVSSSDSSSGDDVGGEGSRPTEGNGHRRYVPSQSQPAIIRSPRRQPSYEGRRLRTMSPQKLIPRRTTYDGVMGGSGQSTSLGRHGGGGGQHRRQRSAEQQQVVRDQKYLDLSMHDRTHRNREDVSPPY